MAQLLKADGTTSAIDEPLTLATMQRLVGGYIEMVRVGPAGEMLIVDEEGLLKHKSVNDAATALYRGTPPRHTGIIVGDAIHCACRHMGLETESYE